jgi:hypothetical protein
VLECSMIMDERIELSVIESVQMQLADPSTGNSQNRSGGLGQLVSNEVARRSLYSQRWQSMNLRPTICQFHARWKYCIRVSKEASRNRLHICATMKQWATVSRKLRGGTADKADNYKRSEPTDRDDQALQKRCVCVLCFHTNINECWLALKR